MNTTKDDPLRWIFGRRSIRVYAPGEVTDAQVKRILEAAMAAPSAMSKDPWRFIVLRNPQALSALSAALPGGAMLSTAAAAIAVCGDQEAAFEQHVSFLLQDCSAAIQNLLLAAHTLGLGAVWVGVHPIEESVRRVRNILQLPTTVIPVAVVSIGVPGEQPEARTRYLDSFVHHEKW